MPLKLVQSGLFSRVGLRKRRGKRYTVVDFRDEHIQLPSGEIIPKNSIISIDTSRKVVVYKDHNDMLREASYVDEQPQSILDTVQRAARKAAPAHM